MLLFLLLLLLKFRHNNNFLDGWQAKHAALEQRHREQRHAEIKWQN